MNHQVFVHELIDPTDSSLLWLEDRGVIIRRGRPMWDFPPYPLSEDEMIERAQDCVALMGAGGNRITRRVIEALPDLKYISKFGIGMESIDLEAAFERDILVSFTPVPEEIDATAEHAIAMMLTLIKRLNDWTPEFMRAGGWRSQYVWADSLEGKTIGLIGYGRVGKAVARRLQGWGVRLLAFDPVSIKDGLVEQVEFDYLLSVSDVISIHAALTNDTFHMISKDQFSKMKPSTLLINTARGKLVNLAELAIALDDEMLAGAAIDVYEEEPPNPSHPLYRCQNIVVTPHAAAWTQRTMRAMGEMGVKNLWFMLQGKQPMYPVLKANSGNGTYKTNNGLKI